MTMGINGMRKRSVEPVAGQAHADMLRSFLSYVERHPLDFICMVRQLRKRKAKEHEYADMERIPEESQEKHSLEVHEIKHGFRVQWPEDGPEVQQSKACPLLKRSMSNPRVVRL